MAWSVGKTMVGSDIPSTVLGAVNERRAQYYLSQIVRQQITAYTLVMTKDDPYGWSKAMARLDRLANKLESGKWPASEDGLNWLWSVPWGSGLTDDRDLWIFWAKAEGGRGGAGDDAEVVPLVPRGGREKELVA